MNIGAAVQALKEGKKVARTGWNGKGMYLFLVHNCEISGQTWIGVPKEVLEVKGAQPFVAMKTVQGTWVPWLCSQTDLLAEDWEVVP